MSEKAHRGQLRRDLAKLARARTRAAKVAAKKLKTRTWQELLERSNPYKRETPPAGLYAMYFDGPDTVRAGWLTYDPVWDYVPETIKEEFVASKMMQIRVDRNLHEWFKRYAAIRGVSMTSVVVRYLEYLRDKENTETELEQI